MSRSFNIFLVLPTREKWIARVQAPSAREALELASAGEVLAGMPVDGVLKTETGDVLRAERAR